jgi:hypothetical protein
VFQDPTKNEVTLGARICRRRLCFTLAWRSTLLAKGWGSSCTARRMVVCPTPQENLRQFSRSRTEVTRSHAAQ